MRSFVKALQASAVLTFLAPAIAGAHGIWIADISPR